MSKIVDMISGIEGMKAIGSCTAEQLEEAQKRLGINFPEEYKDYLMSFGTVRFNGVELCGLNVDGYINVVEATEQEKSVNKDFPEKMFVIEDLGIDAKIVVGDEKGNVYLLQRDKKRLLCSSFSEYIEKCMFR